MVTKLVGRAVTQPRLESTTSKPHRKASQVVIAPIPLGHRRATKLRAKHQNGVLEHVPLLQIRYQRRNSLVDLLGRPFRMRFDGTMVIPIAMVQLNKTHPPLGQPTSEQTVRCKRTIASLGPIQIEDMLRLLRHVHQLRYARLHPKRQLILPNPCGYLRILKPLIGYPIERGDRIDHLPLTERIDPLGITDIQNRIAGPSKLNTLILSRQKS